MENYIRTQYSFLYRYSSQLAEKKENPPFSIVFVFTDSSSFSFSYRWSLAVLCFFKRRGKQE